MNPNNQLSFFQQNKNDQLTDCKRKNEEAILYYRYRTDIRILREIR
jgi:hypothetical protein